MDVTRSVNTPYRARVHNVGSDKQYFSNTAGKTHAGNYVGRPMRGGIRL